MNYIKPEMEIEIFDDLDVVTDSMLDREEIGSGDIIEID